MRRNPLREVDPARPACWGSAPGPDVHRHHLSSSSLVPLREEVPRTSLRIGTLQRQDTVEQGSDFHPLHALIARSYDRPTDFDNVAWLLEAEHEGIPRVGVAMRPMILMVVGMERQDRAWSRHADGTSTATSRATGLLALGMSCGVAVFHRMQQGAERNIRDVLAQAAAGALCVEVEQAPFAFPKRCLDRGVVDVLQARVEHVLTQRCAPGELEPSHQSSLGVLRQFAILRRHRMQELQVTEVGSVEHGIPWTVARSARRPLFGGPEQLDPASGLRLETDGLLALAVRAPRLVRGQAEGGIVIPPHARENGRWRLRRRAARANVSIAAVDPVGDLG